MSVTPFTGNQPSEVVVREQAVLRVIKDHIPPVAVTREFGLGRTTIYKWLRRYEKEGERLFKRYVRGQRAVETLRNHLPQVVGSMIDTLPFEHGLTGELWHPQSIAHLYQKGSGNRIDKRIITRELRDAGVLAPPPLQPSHFKSDVAPGASAHPHSKAQRPKGTRRLQLSLYRIDTPPLLVSYQPSPVGTERMLQRREQCLWLAASRRLKCYLFTCVEDSIALALNTLQDKLNHLATTTSIELIAYSTEEFNDTALKSLEHNRLQPFALQLVTPTAIHTIPSATATTKTKLAKQTSQSPQSLGPVEDKPTQQRRLLRSLLIEIASSNYAEGSKFLSYRTIRSQWNVSKRSVAHAIKYLRKEALINTVNRSGTIIIEGATIRARYLLADIAVHSLPPPENWLTKKQRILVTCSKAAGRVLAIVDGDADLKRIGQTSERIASGVWDANNVPMFHWLPVAFKQKLQTKNVSVDFVPFERTESGSERILRMLQTNRFEGIALCFRTYHPEDDKLAEAISNTGIPTVGMKRDYAHRAHASITFNHAEIGRRIVRLFNKKARRHILIPIPMKAPVWMDELLTGCREYLQRNDLSKAIRLEILHAPGEAMAEKMAQAMTRNKSRPDAIAFTMPHFFLKTATLFPKDTPRLPGYLVVGSPVIGIMSKHPWVDCIDHSLHQIGVIGATNIAKLMKGHPIPKVLFASPTHHRGTTL